MKNGKFRNLQNQKIHSEKFNVKKNKLIQKSYKFK